MTESVFIVHAAACLFMTGVIWFVQIVHYPLFFWVHDREFPTYSSAHRQRTAWVVAPVMFTELGSAVWLLVAGWSWPMSELKWIMVGLLAVIWISTVRIQIPQHRELGRGFDGRLARLLVSFNWLRTVLWSARSLIIIWSLAERVN